MGIACARDPSLFGENVIECRYVEVLPIVASVGVDIDTQLEKEDRYTLLIRIFILNSKSRDPR